MEKNYEDLTYVDLLKKPFYFNHLIKSTSNRFLNNFLSFVEPEDLILDIGSGSESVIPARYKKIEFDLLAENKPYVVGNAAKLPLKDLSVDHICSSWMYEHIEEPVQTLLEFIRVLKIGGYLYLTTNFVWHLHEEPNDFHRYTKHGLNYLFNNHGNWNILFLEPTGGFWLCMSQLLNYKLSRVLGLLHPILTLPSQLIGLFFERINFDPSITAGYCIIVQKNK